MACLNYELTCPIGAQGGECRWSIVCCNGTVQRVTLLEGETATPCIDTSNTRYDGQPVRRNSISGITEIIDVPCNTDCGTYAPSPIPTPPVPPVPPLPAFVPPLAPVAPPAPPDPFT